MRWHRFSGLIKQAKLGLCLDGSASADLVEEKENGYELSVRGIFTFGAVLDAPAIIPDNETAGSDELASGAILLDARVAFDVEHMVSFQRAPEDSRGGSGRRHGAGM